MKKLLEILAIAVLVLPTFYAVANYPVLF